MNVPVPDLPPGIGLRRLDHVGIAVSDIGAAAALFCGLLGGEFLHGGDSASLHIRTAQFLFPGGMKIELLQPTTEDSYLAAYIAKHGQGFHHLTLLFADVGVAIARLQEHGYELVDIDLTRPQWREAYLRPRHGFGTLLQLVDSTLEWNDPASTGITLDDVLAGRVVWDAEERPIPVH